VKVAEKFLNGIYYVKCVITKSIATKIFLPYLDIDVNHNNKWISLYDSRRRKSHLKLGLLRYWFFFEKRTCLVSNSMWRLVARLCSIVWGAETQKKLGVDEKQ
jgi:hypothetical protein